MDYKHAEYCYENNDHEGESFVLMIFTTRIYMRMLFNLRNLALLQDRFTLEIIMFNAVLLLTRSVSAFSTDN